MAERSEATLKIFRRGALLRSAILTLAGKVTN